MGRATELNVMGRPLYTPMAASQTHMPVGSVQMGGPQPAFVGKSVGNRGAYGLKNSAAAQEGDAAAAPAAEEEKKPSSLLPSLLLAGGYQGFKGLSGVLSQDMTITTIGVSTVALQATMIATWVLLLKMLATTIIQGGKRFYAGTRPSEDVQYAPDLGAQSVLVVPDPDKEVAREAEARWNRIVMNDVENIPMGLIAAWGSLMCNANPTAHVVLVVIFTLARLGHTISYAKAKQPARALCWMTALGASVGLCVNGLLGLFPLNF